jgi:hypothetical protein
MGQRIKDLGSVSGTATCDRADADLFKMSTSDALEITFANFEDGDFVMVAVAFTGASSRTLTFSNATLTVGYVGHDASQIGLASGRTSYVLFRMFDGTFIEIGENSTAAP